MVFHRGRIPELGYKRYPRAAFCRLPPGRPGTGWAKINRDSRSLRTPIKTGTIESRRIQDPPFPLFVSLSLPSWARHAIVEYLSRGRILTVQSPDQVLALRNAHTLLFLLLPSPCFVTPNNVMRSDATPSVRTTSRNRELFFPQLRGTPQNAAIIAGGTYGGSRGALRKGRDRPCMIFACHRSLCVRVCLCVCNPPSWLPDREKTLGLLANS